MMLRAEATADARRGVDPTAAFEAHHAVSRADLRSLRLVGLGRIASLLL